MLNIPDAKEYINEDKTEDSLLEEAKDIVGSYDKASASLIQRKLSIGYASAARILDQLEIAGVVGRVHPLTLFPLVIIG